MAKSKGKTPHYTSVKGPGLPIRAVPSREYTSFESIWPKDEVCMWSADLEEKNLCEGEAIPNMT